MKFECARHFNSEITLLQLMKYFTFNFFFQFGLSGVNWPQKWELSANNFQLASIITQSVSAFKQSFRFNKLLTLYQEITPSTFKPPPPAWIFGIRQDWSIRFSHQVMSLFLESYQSRQPLSYLLIIHFLWFLDNFSLCLFLIRHQWHKVWSSHAVTYLV